MKSIYQSGMTLIELIISIVVLAIAVVALSMTVSFNASHSADAMIQVKVTELGQAYLEEALHHRFDETTPVGGVPACTSCSVAGNDGEARANFDDVDDYDGLDESPPLDALGNVRTGYAGYRVQMSVTYVSAAEIAGYGLDGSIDGKLITATISPPSGTPVSFSVYRGNF